MYRVFTREGTPVSETKSHHRALLDATKAAKSTKDETHIYHQMDEDSEWELVAIVGSR